MWHPIKNFSSSLIHRLREYSNSIWYPYLIGLLVALDNFLLIVPTDAMTVSAVMLEPKKWIRYALIVAISSSIGAICLAFIVDIYGQTFIETVFPGLEQTRMWILTDKFMADYGLLVVFVIAVTPLTQPPAVILAALSHMPLGYIFLAILVGRSIKYLLIAWISSHAPRLLGKMWGMRGELKDVDELKELA